MAALRAIQLTPDQQSKLRQIMDSERSQSEAAMSHLHSIHEQITNKLLGTGRVSEAELAPLSRQANEIDRQVQERSLNTALRVRAFLTPEQLATMNQFHQQVTSINAQIEKLMHGTPLNTPPR
jgi:Spy/CpxP family protein refolding chaperone